MIRIGLIDFDTSHVQAFTQRLNHLEVGAEDWVQGAEVVAGCPGESAIMPERIPIYRDKLAAYGVALVERPEDLIGQVDAVMIESQQGRAHWERARIFLDAGLPVYVDKPFAETVADADAMIALAQKRGVPLMSCSSLRYDPAVTAALQKRAELGALLSADIWTSATLHEGNPGMLHYGIHGVEMLYAMMGTGCSTVSMTFTESGEVAAGVWSSGHIGVVRGLRSSQGGFGLAAHYEKGHAAFFVEGAAFYREMLKVIVQMFATGEPPIPYAEMREIVAFIAAAEESRKSGGVPARVSD